MINVLKDGKHVSLYSNIRIIYATFSCYIFNYLAPRGGCEVLFSPGLSVCVSVCPADILVFYFSATRRDIDLKFMQDTYRAVLN